MNKQWYLRPQVLVAAGIFVLTLAVYTATLGPTTDFWDCGEFITTSHIVGVPHQPGTPLYVLVGRVFDIFLGDADITQPAMRTAWAINFMSAFFSALAVMMLYLVIWELARRMHPDSGVFAHLGGAVGAIFLAFSDTFWNNAIEAEVYGLAAFMIILLTWLVIRWYEHMAHPGSNNLLLLMIYLLGLGVGFHLGSVLVYPGIFILVFLMSYQKRATLPWVDLLIMSGGLGIFLLSTMHRENGLILGLLAVYLLVVVFRAVTGHRFALWGSALFFLGLTVHIMMLIRAGANPEPFINQTAPDNFETLMSVIRREQYPTLSSLDRKAPLAFQFGYYYKFLLKQFYFLGDGTSALSVASTLIGPLLLAVVGLVQGLRRIFPLMLVPVVNYIFNGEILTLVLNFANPEVRDRDYFYFAAFLFVAIFIGLGVTALLRFYVGKEGLSAEAMKKAGQAWRSATQIKPTGLVLVSAGVLLVISLAPILPSHQKFFEHDRSENRIAYEYAWNILAGLDDNAIIFTNGDNDTFPIWYLQAVEHFRRDVTVVNLSLINLPWYIKQLKNADHPLDFGMTEEEIDAIDARARRYQEMFRDLRTGRIGLRLPRSDTQIEAMSQAERENFLLSCIWELKNGDHRKVLRSAPVSPQPSRYVQSVLYESLLVKDYILPRIIATNQDNLQRPVFFAVTIPQENMDRWFSRLQMEGMAYRLLDTPSEDGIPVTDARKVLENMLGVYRMDALMDGNTAERQSAYAEMAGLAGDQGQLILGQEGRQLSSGDLSRLSGMFGQKRRDVFRNQNATHLLGNYPAAFNRAGYESYQLANEVALTDTAAYQRYLDDAMVAFETCLRVEPFNPQAMEFYPLLLVQAYRDNEAKAFLSSLAGNVPWETEQRIVVSTIQGFVRGGVTSLALEWVGEQVSARPERQFYRQLLFSIYQSLGRVAEARMVMDEWTAYHGSEDPEMRRGYEEMLQQAPPAAQPPNNNPGE
nr:DUF2723 domain-containing protein [Candidatus Krumholzibacteria bacterium]